MSPTPRPTDLRYIGRQQVLAFAGPAQLVDCRYSSVALAKLDQQVILIDLATATTTLIAPDLYRDWDTTGFRPAQVWILDQAQPTLIIAAGVRGTQRTPSSYGYEHGLVFDDAAVELRWQDLTSGRGGLIASMPVGSITWDTATRAVLSHDGPYVVVNLGGPRLGVWRLERKEASS